MGNRQETHSDQRALILTLLASILSTVYCAFLLLRIPADSKNAFLFGLSKERLLMLSGYAVFFLLFIILFFLRDKAAEILQKKTFLKSIFLCGAVVSLFFLLMPDYRFGRFSAIFIHIKPYILWLFSVSAAFSLYYGYLNDRFLPVRETIKNLGTQKVYIFPTLCILLAGMAFTEITGLGKTVESSLWNKNGIPLQSIQLFISFVIFCLLWKTGVFKRIGSSKIVSNFFLIWFVSAFIWSLAPEMHHFFAPGPYEPNHTFYPYSDASSYDLQAQTALNGWGFNYGDSLLKPTVVFMTFISRLITGNDTTKSMLVQSAIYAVLPAIIYLFGTAVGGNGCGYLAAVFSLLREWNAIRTRSVSTVHSRLVMSEFLTQILLALLCYAVFRWLKKNGRESLYAIITGGALTLGSFTRYNFFAFFPAVLLILIIGYWKQFRRLWKPLFFFFLSMLLTAAPYLYREKNITWNIFSELTYTIKYVLIRQRIMGEPPLTAEQVTALMHGESIDNQTSEPENEAQISQPETEEDGTGPVIISTDEKISDNAVSDKTSEIHETKEDEFNTGQITEEFTNISSYKNLPLFASIINHSLHNLISSFLALPLELTFHDLHHIYTQEGDGLWKDNWQGTFSVRQWISIGIWVLLFSAGIGVLIKTHGLAGFSIIYFGIVYALSIGISRSSGGRYIVPINWIPTLLLAFCCSLILSRGKIEIPEAHFNKLPAWQPVCALAGFFCFFSAMILFEKLIPQKITSAPEGDLSVLKERLSDQTYINWDLVESQFEEGTLHITHGVSEYPRFYYFRGGEHISRGALMRKEFSRMTFIGLGMDDGRRSSAEYMIPRMNLISEFPQDSVYRAISCTSEFGYEDVLAVTIDTPSGEVYTYLRNPLPEFACPVPEPVCPSIENCY